VLSGVPDSRHVCQPAHLTLKDPTQNIAWVRPEGGGGRNYAGM
jgi:hypothetical protein